MLFRYPLSRVRIPDSGMTRNDIDLQFYFYSYISFLLSNKYLLLILLCINTVLKTCEILEEHILFQITFFTGRSEYCVVCVCYKNNNIENTLMTIVYFKLNCHQPYHTYRFIIIFSKIILIFLRFIINLFIINIFSVGISYICRLYLQVNCIIRDFHILLFS